MVLQLYCYDQNDYLSWLTTYMYTYIHTFGGKCLQLLKETATITQLAKQALGDSRKEKLPFNRNFLLKGKF